MTSTDAADADPTADSAADARVLERAAAALAEGLAATAVLPALQDALSGVGAAVVHAPPGTGKTTAVPPAVALGAAAGGRVVVTQPRRVAVRAAWRRLHGAVRAAGAEPTRADRVAGYAVRGDAVGRGRSRVEFVTPGLLVRRLLADPGLEDVAAVVLDEVHERDLDTDVLFALLADLRQLRPELRLVAMSATVDADALAERWALGMGLAPGQMPVVRTRAEQHPLTVEHAPFGRPRLTPEGRVDPAFLDHVAEAAAGAHAEALAADPSVDMLVFVPGAREAVQVAERLAHRAPGTEVLTLHGRQEAAVQDAALAGRTDPARPRAVVATDVAESSLTVPGVRLVVDAALAREPRRDRGRGMTGLVTVQVSGAAADQRAGRAARLGPGTVVRCCTPGALGAAPAAPTPALAVADLTGPALAFAVWGAPGGVGLVLPEDPPADAMVEAVRTLGELGAVDDAGRVTDHGRRLAALPADPALGHALLCGAERVGAGVAAETTALLALGLRAPAADLEALLARLRSGDHPEARRWAAEARRLARLVGADLDAGPGSGRGQGAGTGRARRGPDAAAHAVGTVVALAAPDRLARRVGGDPVWLLASGTRAALPPEVAGSDLLAAQWLAVAEVQRVAGAAEGTGALVRAAAPVDEATALECGARLIREDVEAGWQQDRLRARRVRRLGAIELGEEPAEPDRAAAAAAVRAALAADGLARFEPSAGGRPGAGERLRRRVQLLHRVLGAPWPDLRDAALAADPDVVAALAAPLAAGARARDVDVAGLLRGLLPWPEAGRLDELAPERLPLPSGRDVAVEYPVADDDGAPVLAAKLQEFFGAAATPTVAQGRVPVLLHLLSPAGRPLAVTADLPSFWTGAYAGVRAENRGRYPKHPWPQDPATAEATALTNSRLRARGQG